MKLLRITTALAAVILTASTLSTTAQAQEKIEVPWGELGRTLNGQVVSTVLVDGTVLRGRVLEVSDNELRFEVKKTSNRSIYPKGELSLAKNQLTVFSYTERRGHWRAAGTAIGAAVGAAAISPVLILGAGESDESPVPAYALYGGIGAGIGYLVGNQSDKHEVTVIVATE